MNFKNLIFLLLLTMPLSLLAQFKLIEKGSKEPVSFGHILVKGKYEGTIADYNGNFSIDTIKFANDSLDLSCIGFKTRTISVVQLKKVRTVALELSDIQLKEVIVTTKKRKLYSRKMGIVGRSKKWFFDNTVTGENGQEKATYMPNNYGVAGKLETVNVFVSDVGFPDAHFRVHIYDCSPIEIKPGKELTTTNIIVAGTEGDEWVTIDLSEYNITIGESGCFVGIEWFDSPKSKYFRDSLDITYSVYRDGKYKDSAGFIVMKGNGMALACDHRNFIEAENVIWRRAALMSDWKERTQTLKEKGYFFKNDTLPDGRIREHKPENFYYRIPRIYITALLPKSKLKTGYKNPKKRKLNKIEKVKYDAFKYPQASVLELFKSIKAAFAADEIVYVLKYLCIYKKGELEEILDDENEEGEFLSEEEKRTVINNLEELIQEITSENLVKIKDKHFELKTSIGDFNLILENGRWKLNPYSKSVIHVVE